MVVRYPNFFIAGAQKCGTTTLARELSRLENVFIHNRELHYFDNRTFKYEKYLNEFCKRSEMWIGEKTPSYLDKPHEGFAKWDTSQIFANYCLEHDARVIYCMRNPVERFESALNHHIVKGRFNPYRHYEMKEFFSNNFAYYNLLGKGEYDHALGLLKRRNIKHQIMVFEEDLNPGFTNRIADWLGTKSTHRSKEYSRENARRAHPFNCFLRYILPEHKIIHKLIPMGKSDVKFRLSPENKEKLREYYRDSVFRASDLIDRDLAAIWQFH